MLYTNISALESKLSELQAQYQSLEVSFKEATKEFKINFSTEMVDKFNTIPDSDASLEEAHSDLLHAYWAYGESVSNLVEEYLFLEPRAYNFYKGEWFKSALRVEKIQEEMNRVFYSILIEYKRRIREELEKLQVDLKIIQAFNGDCESLLKRKKDLEDELEHPQITKRELLAIR